MYMYRPLNSNGTVVKRIPVADIILGATSVITAIEQQQLFPPMRQRPADESIFRRPLDLAATRQCASSSLFIGRRRKR